MIAHARKRRWSITAGILRSERQHSGILNLMTACAKKAVEIRSVLAMADSTLEGSGMERLALVKDAAHVKCCRGAQVNVSLSDGVLVGSCSRCNKNVVRVNPRTGNQEWLHGESPWSEKDATQ